MRVSPTYAEEMTSETSMWYKIKQKFTVQNKPPEGCVHSGTIRRRGYGYTKEEALRDAEAKLDKEAVLQYADIFVVTEKRREHKPFPLLRTILTVDRAIYSYTLTADLYNKSETSILRKMRLTDNGIGIVNFD